MRHCSHMLAPWRLRALRASPALASFLLALLVCALCGRGALAVNEGVIAFAAPSFRVSENVGAASIKVVRTCLPSNSTGCPGVVSVGYSTESAFTYRLPGTVSVRAATNKVNTTVSLMELISPGDVVKVGTDDVSCHRLLKTCARAAFGFLA